MNPPSSPVEVKRIEVLGTQIDVLNLQSACDRVFEAIQNKQKSYVCVVGVHGVIEAYDHADFHEVLRNAYMCTPDGVPMVWLGKYYGHHEMDRVYGPDLMLEVCRQSVERGYTHFLYGGDPGVAEDLKNKLTERFPGLKIVGTYCPPYRPLHEAEEKDVIQQIATLKPDMIWVGIGTPKQERFMAEYLSKLDTYVMFGVGAAFNFHTHRVKQAPLWMQRNGLEWLYRLFQEPRRLIRRYLRINTLFILRMLFGSSPAHFQKSESHL